MNRHRISGLAFFPLAACLGASVQARTTAHIRYAKMAPIAQYLIARRKAEIALARTAAPPAIARRAAVMVLERTGYKLAAPGHNGFLCLVERSWGKSTDSGEFWNPKVRAPICFNAAAAKSYVPIYLLKTKWVLAGKTKPAIARALAAAFRQQQLPRLKRGAMCYMMSAQQYLNDRAKNWHSHVMFYVPESEDQSWGANQPGSPVIAVNDPQEKMKVYMVLVSHWSDGKPSPTR